MRIRRRLVRHAGRVGVSQKTPARKWRAMGRIEHSLMVRAIPPTDLRPPPAPPAYHKKSRMFHSTIAMAG